MKQLIITPSITRRDCMSLDIYLREINNIKLLTYEEEVELTVRIRNNDKEAVNELVAANLRFVVSVAKQFQNQGIPLSDLINEGNIGLIKAALRFDDTRGFRFISYAVWWIKQSILQSLRNYSKAVQLPTYHDNMVFKCNEIIQKFDQIQQRVPTFEELAEILQIPVVKINEIMQNTLIGVSFDEPVRDSSECFIFLDIFEHKDVVQSDGCLITQSLIDDVQRVFKKLTKRECNILSLSFGIGNNEVTTIEKIALKLKLSRERVRQIREKALKSIRNSHSLNLLRSYLG